MDNLTFEIVSDPGDPLDRSLGVLGRIDGKLSVCRSIRIQRVVTMGVVLTWIDRIVLCWAQPQLGTPVDMHELLDQCERTIGDPF